MSPQMDIKIKSGGLFVGMVAILHDHITKFLAYSCWNRLYYPFSEYFYNVFPIRKSNGKSCFSLIIMSDNCGYLTGQNKALLYTFSLRGSAANTYPRLEIVFIYMGLFLSFSIFWRIRLTVFVMALRQLSLFSSQTSS